jgi:zinc protease
MRRLIATSLLALALSACASVPGSSVASAPPAPAAPVAKPTPQPAPLSELVAKVDIPYEKFVLANGLTVLVHTDRKAPIVGVTT